MTMETVKLGPWPLGMDMCARDASLGEQPRLIVNMDVNSEGRLSARRKTQKLLDLAGAHSLTAFAGRLYGVHGGQVFNCVPGGPITYLAPVGPARMRWALHDGDLYGVSHSGLVRVGATHTQLPWGTYQGSSDADGVRYTAPTTADVFAAFGAHLLFATGRALSWTAAFQPQAIASRDFVCVPDDIVLLAPVEGGVFVASRKHTWLLEGRVPSRWVLTKRADVGAIGSDFAYRDGAAWWLTPRGFASGADTGELAFPQQAAVALGGAVAAVLPAPWDNDHYIATVAEPVLTAHADESLTTAITF